MRPHRPARSAAQAAASRAYPCCGFDVLTVSGVTETCATPVGQAAGTVARLARTGTSPMRCTLGYEAAKSAGSDVALGSVGVSDRDLGFQIIVKII